MYKETLELKRNIKNARKFERSLNEGFNQAVLDDAIQLIKALKSIDFSKAGMQGLASARDTALSDIDEIISVESRQGFMKKLASLFKQKKNPLIDVLALCDAMKNFFTGMTKYLEARKTGVQNADEKVVKNLVIDPNASRSIKSMTDDRKQIQNLQNLIINGLKPEPYLKKVATNAWQQRYLKNGYSEIAKDIMNAKVSDVETVAKTVIEAFKDVSAIARLAIDSQTTAPKSTKGSTGSEQTSTTQLSTDSAKSSGSEQTGLGGSDAKKVAVGIANDVYSSLPSKFGDIPAETVKKIIAVLAYNDMIKQ